MRKILFLLSLLWCIVSNAQYHCTVISATRSDVTLRSTGYGKNVKLATKDAEQNAINTLLYSGVEGTSYSLPLIPITRSEAESQNKKFFENFYDISYKDFIMSSVTVTAFGKDAEKRKCVTLDVCVRAESLRSFLEKNGVIRRFGF